MGETPDLNPEANPNRAHDLLRSEGLNLPARDPLLRRSVCAAGQPASSQVSQRIGLAESDRKFPPLTGRSGTQRARGLQSRTTDGSVTPWSSLPSPGLFPATRPRPVLAQAPPSNPIAAEPDGRRLLSRGGAADHEVTPNAPLTGSGCRGNSYGGFGEDTHTSTRMPSSEAQLRYGALTRP